MNKRGFHIFEIIIVVLIIGFCAAILIPRLINVSTDVQARQEELRKPQIISIDEEGNKLWRVYDKDTMKYIYYMPKGETSWREPSGKSSIPMGVK